jgi:hypothetical protein
MMVIHAVTAGDDRETAAAVLGERLEHVIEKLDVGRDVDRAAVEFQPQVDLRFFGRALDRRTPTDQFNTPLTGGAATVAGAPLR